MRCYRNGTVLIKNKWVGDRHLNVAGYMDRNRWVLKKVDGKWTSVFVGDDGRWIEDFAGGWQQTENGYFYYSDKGAMKTGWIKENGKKYYADPETGKRVKGIFGVDNALYYFSSRGVMQTNKTVTSQKREYTIDEDGKCTLVPQKGAPSASMLFFLRFESGAEAYAQTGGDYGNACGAYQFDNRYSLLPFVKYAYRQNPNLCLEFKPYAAYTDGTKLKSNRNFFAAWKRVYQRNPQLFAELQDTFAKEEYFDPVERALSQVGINLGTRPDTVKGAVYSYSIQHGQQKAVNAVRACGNKNSTEDRQFLKNLYSYRMRQFPKYKSRYLSEYTLALQTLSREKK